MQCNATLQSPRTLWSGMTNTETIPTNSKDQGIWQPVIGSIVLYMYMSEKTDRVIWQVTKMTGVPILGRIQAKLMKLYQSPRDTCTSRTRTVSSLTGQSSVYRLHPQSKDFKPQSTVCRDCTVYGKS